MRIASSLPLQTDNGRVLRTFRINGLVEMGPWNDTEINQKNNLFQNIQLNSLLHQLNPQNFNILILLISIQTMEHWLSFWRNYKVFATKQFQWLRIEREWRWYDSVLYQFNNILIPLQVILLFMFFLVPSSVYLLFYPITLLQYINTRVIKYL